MDLNATTFIFFVVYLVTGLFSWWIVQPQVKRIQKGKKPKIWPFIVVAILVVAVIVSPIRFSDKSDNHRVIQRFDQEVQRDIEIERIERKQYEAPSNEEVINQLYK